MRLDLRDILYDPGAEIPFSFQMDLSDLDFGGECPAVHPVDVQGRVKNVADTLELKGSVSAVLELHCDRCCKPFSEQFSVRLDSLLATELADEENEDEIILLDGTELDLDETARTAFVLAMDTRHLCSEDCKGICPGCGADLNVESCRCKREVDPRLAALAQLLENKEEN